MTTTLSITPEAASAIRDLVAERINWATARTLATFAATPDDKLDFKPSETARSIRECILHTLEGNGYVGHALGIEDNPQEGPTDRAALEGRLKSATEKIVAKIKTLPDETIAGSTEFFGHPMPTPSFLFLIEWHISRHTGQIDYLQTIYGDMEDHG